MDSLTDEITKVCRQYADVIAARAFAAAEEYLEQQLRAKGLGNRPKAKAKPAVKHVKHVKLARVAKRRRAAVAAKVGRGKPAHRRRCKTCLKRGHDGRNCPAR
jgi:hypothetical protein